MYHGERFNSSTHLIGTALAISGSAYLVARASIGGDPWKIVSFSLFGTMLVALYAISTLYHSIRAARPKAVLRRLDHCAIYLLIAGTYTPFTLVTLRGWVGWAIFCTIWAMALYGIVRAWRYRGGDDPSVWPYLVMGWLGVCAAVPLIARLGAGGILWLAAGGLLYTAGVVFFVNDTRWRHAHGIWHLFVIGGSSAHFIAVLRYVA
ncbi:MAG TPA: hemolysin III family protein [Burkholderiaceae bacterium]|nr:hemolysin III family protein [Burkholderiaceae bacterium]HQR71861.1 hemolysin III family protein [Burkholderiaceae bacterium]